MPRYVFETPPIAQSALDRAITLAARRFPELAIEHRSAGADEVDGYDVWACHAPHATHLLRWAAAAGIDVTATALNDSANALAFLLPSLATHRPGTLPVVHHQQRKEVQP